MPRPDFTVDTINLRNLGLEIKKLGEEFVVEGKKFYSEVDKVHNDWEGEDSDEYFNSAKSHENNIYSLGEVMVNIGLYLMRTSTSHEARISSIKTSAKKLYANRM